VLIYCVFTDELDISNANMDEKDIEMEKLRKQLQERTDELRYTSNVDTMYL